MRTLILLICIQTNVMAFLPHGQDIFNIYIKEDKCKNYIDKDAIKKPDHSTVYSFGQSRFNNSSHKLVKSDEEIAALYDMDWEEFAMKTVILDPGHGGKDDGTSTKSGIKEKNVALDIAKRLGAYITTNHPKVKVVYTRSTDVFVPLKKRAKIANDNKADLFISIHCNSFKNKSVKGMETYVMGLDRANENMAVIKRENDVVKLEEDYENQYEEYGVDKDSPLYDILMNSYQNAYLEQSLVFAASLDKKVKGKGKSTRGVHQAGFLVLRRTAMPSVLIETGYLSNTAEMKYLNSIKGKDEVARNIYAAFTEFKAEMETANTNSDFNSKSPNTNKNISFGIQLASVGKKLDLKERKWDALRSRLVIEASSDGMYRYVIKDFGQNYQKAENEKKWLEKRGFRDSFIVAYKDKRRIDLYKAKTELGMK